MVALLGLMWGTAMAQAIIPWFVFWPLFILTQLVIWGCVFLGCIRLFIGLLSFIEDGVRGSFRSRRSNSVFFPDRKWESYKSQYLR